MNNTELRFLHDEKAKISCPNQDSAGVYVPIFTDRLCDNHFDCEDGSDENGSMYECQQEKAGIYGLGFFRLDLKFEINLALYSVLQANLGKPHF